MILVRCFASLLMFALVLMALPTASSIAQTKPKPDPARFAEALRAHAAREAATRNGRYAIIRANLSEYSRRKLRKIGDDDPRSLIIKQDFVLAEGTIPIDRDPYSQRAMDSQLDRIQSSIEGGTRIADGTEVDEGEHENVALFYRHQAGNDPEGPICTGTYIGGNVIISAAHCVCEYLGKDGVQLRDVKVKFAWNIDDSKPERTFEVTKYTLLVPTYCKTFNSTDVATVKGKDLTVFHFSETAVDGKSKFKNLDIEPAEIAEPLMILAGSTFKYRLVGFGSTGLGAGDAGVMRQVNVPVLDRLCTAAEGCTPGREVVLVDPRLKEDTCRGDSGGPAFIELPGKGTFLLAAVTSRAVGLGDCGQGGVYSIITPKIVRWLSTMVTLTRCVSMDLCLKRRR